MKWYACGIAALAFLHPAECHLHNHRGNSWLSRREVNQDVAARRCPKGTTTTTTVTVHIDEHVNTLGMEEANMSSEPPRLVASALNFQVPDSSSSIPSATVLTSASAPSLSLLKTPSPPLQTFSDDLQSARFLPWPQATDISQLTNYNPLDSNPIPDVPEEYLGSNNYGISYSPYKADSTCKTQEEVNKDIHRLRQFSYVRFYGVDCNQAQTVTNAARANGMQVFAGIFELADWRDDLQEIIDAADGDWSTFHTVSVGNELINRGQSSPAEIVEALNSARQLLRQAGYRGPVVTVDTVNSLVTHPELCDASDYCAANSHAFFDANETPEDAGPYVLDQARKVSKATKGGSKKVIITETGWPTAGEANGKAVPSIQNQIIALRSLKQSFPDGGIIFFSAFDDQWKQDNAWTFGTEKHWGLVELSGIGAPLIPEDSLDSLLNSV